MSEAKCCYIPSGKAEDPGCQAHAEWEIWDRGQVDPNLANTQACTDHVGHLLGPSNSYLIIPMRLAVKEINYSYDDQEDEDRVW